MKENKIETKSIVFNSDTAAHIYNHILVRYLTKKKKSGNSTKHCIVLSKLAYLSGKLWLS